MRLSRFHLATVKEVPADAEIASHRLMLRAGMLRKLAAGVYTWSPLGLRVLKKVEAIVREEMNRAGAIELLMPSIQPKELWDETGRWEKFGGQLLKIRDRKDAWYCYGPTHEEVVTDFARNELKSYRQLPVNFYQIQTKFRDEIRPRFGVMRAREFLMKDAYSFHLDEASLADEYRNMYETYARIFTRLDLRFRAVQADTGAIGGSASHEFQVLADSGEDAIAFSTDSDYAANIEMAEALAPSTSRPATRSPPPASIRAPTWIRICSTSSASRTRSFSRAGSNSPSAPASSNAANRSAPCSAASSPTAARPGSSRSSPPASRPPCAPRTSPSTSGKPSPASPSTTPPSPPRPRPPAIRNPSVAAAPP